MRKKPHAKAAKDAKARQKTSLLQPNVCSLFGKLFLKPAFPIPLRPSRPLREALLFELHGSGLVMVLVAGMIRVPGVVAVAVGGCASRKQKRPCQCDGEHEECEVDS